MATVQDIITDADRYYYNQVSDANKIRDLNRIHMEIFSRIKRLGQSFEIHADTTVADQLNYTLPSNCTIDNIIMLKISETEEITSATTWKNFSHAALNDPVTSGYYYGRVTDSVIAITENGLPITTSDLSIRLFYYKKPTALTTVNDVPELEAQYHNLLLYALIQCLASQGHSPDFEVADYYQKKFDEEYMIAELGLSDKFNTAPAINSEVREWY